MVQFDGCYVLRTDRIDFSDKQIRQRYVMLTRIENAIRPMKSSLGLRPNFHQKENRAHTHMFISMPAYHILHSIEYMYRQHVDHRTWTTVRDVLATHKRLTIEFDFKEHDDLKRHHLRSCSNPEPEHMEIS